MAGCRLKPPPRQAPRLAVVMLRRPPAALVSVEPGPATQPAALPPRTVPPAPSPRLAQPQGAAQTES